MRAALALLLCAAALRAGDDLETLVLQLGEADYSRRDLAYKALQRRRDPRAVPMIEKRLSGWPLANQHLGILLIAALPPKTSRPSLARLTKSADPHLRMSAAVQLYLRGERERIELIVRTLRASGIDEDRIGSMIQCARNLNSAEVHEAVRDLIRPERTAMNLYAILDAFGREQYGGAKQQAHALLVDGRSGVRAVALAYLFRFGEAQRGDELAELIEAGGADVSSFARVRTLLESAPHGDQKVLAAVAARCAVETNASLATSMIQLLVRRRYRAAIPVFKELVENVDAKVARAAVEALTDLSAAPDADALVRMLEDEDDERVLVAARLLRRMDDPRGLTAVIRIVRQHADLRRDAVTILGEFRAAEAVDPLIDALMDEDQSVRSYAATALQATFRTLMPYRRISLDAAGYDARKPKAARELAVAQIRAWWTRNRDAEW